jgi:hypothetical protein
MMGTGYVKETSGSQLKYQGFVESRKLRNNTRSHLKKAK